jgi:hypothetical protein
LAQEIERKRREAFLQENADKVLNADKVKLLV